MTPSVIHHHHPLRSGMIFTLLLTVLTVALQVSASTTTLYPNVFDGTSLLVTLPTLGVTTTPTHIRSFNATLYPACSTYAVQHALWSDDNFNAVNGSGVNYHTQILATSIATSVGIPALRVSILDESALCADVTLTVLIDGEKAPLYYGKASSAAATLFINQFNGGHLVNLQNAMNLALNITNFQILAVAQPGSYVNSNIVASTPRSTASIIASLLACFICPLIGAAVALGVYVRWVKISAKKARKAEKLKAKALADDSSKQSTQTERLRERNAAQRNPAASIQMSDIGGGPGVKSHLPSAPPSVVAISMPTSNIGSDSSNDLSVSEASPSANAPPATAASVVKSIWTSMKDKTNLQFFVPLFLFVFALGIIPYITTEKGTAWHSRGGVNAGTCAVFGYTSTQTAKCSDDLSWSMLQSISDVMIEWCAMFLGLLACCTGLFSFQADGSLFAPLLGLYFLGDFFSGMQASWVANFSIRVGQVNMSTMIAVGQLIQTCFAVLVLTLCLLPLQKRLSKTAQTILLAAVGCASFIVHVAVGQTINSLSVDGILNIQKASLAIGTLALVLAVIALSRTPKSHELILRGYTFAMLSVWIGLVIVVALQARASTVQGVDLLTTPLNGEQIHLGLYTIMAQLIAMSFVIRHGLCAYSDMDQVNSVLAVISTVNANTASQAHAKIMTLLPANFRSESQGTDAARGEGSDRNTQTRSYRRVLKYVLRDFHLYIVIVLAGVFTIIPITTDRFVQFCQVKGFGADLPACAVTLASALRGSLDHEVLELSSAFLCITVFLLSLAHFHTRRDWITVMYGLAFLGTGCADIFHTLVGMRILHGQDNTNFIPFSWAMSRIYNSVILAVGTSFFLFVGSLDPNLPRANWVICGLGLVLIVPLLGAMVMVANLSVLPTTQYPTGVARPYDVFPLALYILFALEIFALCVKESRKAQAQAQAAAALQDAPRHGGYNNASMIGGHTRMSQIGGTNQSMIGVNNNMTIIGGRIVQQQPVAPQPLVTFQGTNLYLLYALAFSSLPQIITQCYMAFGSTVIYDDNFNIAHFLKIVAYLFPFLAMVTDIGAALTEKNRVIAALNKAISGISVKSSGKVEMTFQPSSPKSNNSQVSGTSSPSHGSVAHPPKRVPSAAPSVNAAPGSPVAVGGTGGAVNRFDSPAVSPKASPIAVSLGQVEELPCSSPSKQEPVNVESVDVTINAAAPAGNEVPSTPMSTHRIRLHLQPTKATESV